MDNRWIRHFRDKEELTKAKEAIKNSKYTLDILIKVLEKEVQEKDKTSQEDYEIPNWACYQADRNGYKRALKSFIKLLQINEDS